MTEMIIDYRPAEWKSPEQKTWPLLQQWILSSLFLGKKTKHGVLASSEGDSAVKSQRDSHDFTEVLGGSGGSVSTDEQDVCSEEIGF